MILGGERVILRLKMYQNPLYFLMKNEENKLFHQISRTSIGII